MKPFIIRKQNLTVVSAELELRGIVTGPDGAAPSIEPTHETLADGKTIAGSEILIR